MIKATAAPSKFVLERQKNMKEIAEWKGRGRHCGDAYMHPVEGLGSLIGALDSTSGGGRTLD